MRFFGGKVLEKVQKFWKLVIPNLQKFWKFWKFQTFQKLRKNDVQLEIQKSRKTRSDSKTDSKVRLKVGNAGP